MPRIERNIAPGTVHHIYNRGINKMTIFYSNKDYDRFIEKIFYFKDKYKVKILAFALLPNHWHLLAKESESTPGVVDMIRCLCNAYVKYFNILHERSGPLFQSRFKSKLVSDEIYLETLINYINLNPLKHKIVKNIEDWDYVSHWDYIRKSRFKLLNDDEMIDFAVYQQGVGNYITKLKELEEEF